MFNNMRKNKPFEIILVVLLNIEQSKETVIFKHLGIAAELHTGCIVSFNLFVKISQLFLCKLNY